MSGECGRDNSLAEKIDGLAAIIKDLKAPEANAALLGRIDAFDALMTDAKKTQAMLASKIAGIFETLEKLDIEVKQRFDSYEAECREIKAGQAAISAEIGRLREKIETLG